MRLKVLGIVGALALSGISAAQAQGFWLPTGDQRLRDDVTLLVDEGVILLPTTTWPIPAADVRMAVERVQDENIGNAALYNALQRVRERVAVPEDADKWDSRDVTLTAGRAPLIRDYGTLGRDAGGFTTVGGTTNDRWSTTVSATGVFSPRDGQRLRWDGTDISVRWGNWIFSANQISRSWGPDFGGSLILSDNARPMPQLSLDRMSSKRSSVPILSWIGPWRFSAFLAETESGRPDINHALFMGMRLTMQPLPILELGISRTAQFCGQNPAGTRPPCSLYTISKMLTGHDNTGYDGTTVLNQPGNQMAGFDLRLTSPFKVLPVAIYSQMIAEDSGGRGIIPNRWLALFGGEVWGYMRSGAVLRAGAEYSATYCKWRNPQEQPDCAYRQNTFFAGYRYRGNTIGHPTDSDSETWALRFALTRLTGETWSLKFRHGRLDDVGGVDPYNPLTRGPSKFDAGEVGLQGALWGQDLHLQVGYERQATAAPVRRDGPYGYLQWRRAL